KEARSRTNEVNNAQSGFGAASNPASSVPSTVNRSTGMVETRPSSSLNRAPLTTTGVRAAGQAGGVNQNHISAPSAAGSMASNNAGAALSQPARVETRQGGALPGSYKSLMESAEKAANWSEIEGMNSEKAVRSALSQSLDIQGASIGQARELATRT